ncbi:glycosyl hydrolase 2 galactose-binding domain-containing protein [Bacteroides sedimenti]|uniref:F5/8 type C domain-containing protein n=1 Tax=Bacteroides sedimenti TaxID=2136147 RepID=A0ABN6YZM8_9BACE
MRKICLIVLLLISCKSSYSQTNYYTRGIGVYPGNPQENFSPKLVPDNEHYRNVAKLKSAYHSSSYDYNLTAQLITDGTITDKQPPYINVSTPKGDLPKNEREWLFDRGPYSECNISGDNVYLQLALNDCHTLINKIIINGRVSFNQQRNNGYEIVCYGSNDKKNWKELGKNKGNEFIGKEQAQADSPGKKLTRHFNQTITFNKTVDYIYYKIALKMAGAQEWKISAWDFYCNDKQVLITPSKYFNSTWMSAGNSNEWVYVDFGAPAEFDKVKLYWVNKAIKGKIQISDDADNWKTIANLPGGRFKTDEISVSKTKARYVRVTMDKSADGNQFVLSELEVYGKGGLVAEPKSQPTATNQHVFLSGGNWQLQRASNVKGNGTEISKIEYEPSDWIRATVPGTVLSSYFNVGALPNSNYADNQMQISESFFNSNFWYRDEFEIPANYKNGRIFLNFDGINWKANIFVNGQTVGRIDGAFMRGKFDVTDVVKPGQKNVVAVEIIKNDNIGAIKEKSAMNPDKNGGILGADNPTFHASIGWDWIPTVRGRNIGIWNDVYLSHTGDVTIENPFVRTELALPDTTSAKIFIELTLKNHKNEQVNGKLAGKFGDITLEQEVSLAPQETKVIKLDPSNCAALKLQNPKLWWPKGYGPQYLYDSSFSFNIDGAVSDKKEFKTGIRQMTFDDSNNVLKLYVNGRRFIGRGGNWGFSESNLNYRAREYDIAVAYHADMNFTMIRNWVGQVGDEEFYEACDRYGIMIWQDFWLANPADGPDPDNAEMFMANAEDYLKRIRNHSSIALYVGRNEGNPPEVIDNALRKMIPQVHPGIHYIPNSADGVVSGGGPYRALPVEEYFTMKSGIDKFHSERGMPNVMNYESLLLTFGKNNVWPQNSQWGFHDYTLEGAQQCATFNDMIAKGFGNMNDAKQFAEKAQWINYNGYRGMFEGRNKYRKGLLLWMSHPCWPSMVWQTYDYFLEPTAAYYGCKKACEPLHIQWNPSTNNIEVVNYSAGTHADLTAKAEIRNMDGSIQWTKETKLSSNEDTTEKCFMLEFPQNLSATHFIKLSLIENNQVVSDNFYLRGAEDGNFQAINQLPKVELKSSTNVKKVNGEWIMTTILKNDSATPALMIRLKVVGKKSGERILPIFYSDNYISLMPGENKVITMRFSDADTRGEEPIVVF